MILSITTQIAGNNLQVVASLANPSPLPTGSVFIYQNSGTNILGPYMGVANVSELTTFQVWAGVAIPVFANAYVLYDQALINIVSATPELQQPAVEQVISVLQTEVGVLKLQYMSMYPITATFTI